MSPDPEGGDIIIIMIIIIIIIIIKAINCDWVYNHLRLPTSTHIRDNASVRGYSLFWYPSLFVMCKA